MTADQFEPRGSWRTASFTFGAVAVFYAAWTGAWLLERALERHIDWMTSMKAQFVYWTAMKLLLWVLPSVLLIYLSGRQLQDILSIRRLGSVLVWGIGAGIILIVFALIPRLLSHHRFARPHWGWAFVNAIFVVPPVEEIAFRGAVLGVLERCYRFCAANLLTATLFLGAHIPGWYFQGRLSGQFALPFMRGAISIVLLGCVFGFVMHRSKSVSSSILAHALNNLGNSI